jgi:predicted transposase YdaD
LLARHPQPSPLLNVLQPLAARNVNVVQQEGASWAESIRQADDFDENMQTRLLTLLVQFVAQRFVHLPRQKIDRMLKLTPFEETVAGKEYSQEGLEKGLQQGLQQGYKDNIVAVLEARFGLLPVDLLERIWQINALDRLGTLLRRAATVESLAAFDQGLDDQQRASATGGDEPTHHNGGDAPTQAAPAA